MSFHHLRRNTLELAKKIKPPPKKRNKQAIIRWHQENQQLFGPICKAPLRPQVNSDGDKLVSAVEKYSRVKRFVKQKMLNAVIEKPDEYISDLPLPKAKQRERTKQRVVDENNNKISKDKIKNALAEIGCLENELKSTKKSKHLNSLSSVASFLISNQEKLPNPDLSLTELSEDDLANLEIKSKRTKKPSNAKQRNVSHGHYMGSSFSDLSEEKSTENQESFSFPLYNNLENVSEEESITHFKTMIRDQFCISEKTISSSQILETTSLQSTVVNPEIGSVENEDREILIDVLEPYVEEYLRKKASDLPDPSLPVHLSGYWKSLRDVLKKVDQIEGINVDVVHPVLGYTATADIICCFNGNLVLVDWKSQFRMPASSSDRPLQATACLGAINFDPRITFKKPITCASLIVSFEGGSPGHMLNMKGTTVRMYWSQWMQRWHSFHKQNFEAPEICA